MKNYLILFLSLLTTSLTGLINPPIYHVNTLCHLCLSDLEVGSYYLMEAQAVKHFGTFSVIANPKAKLYMDRSLDLAFSLGSRKEFGANTVGAHCFILDSCNPDISFFETGVCLEYFRGTLDIRANIYYPFPKIKLSTPLLWTSHRWNEIEITKHMESFSLTGALLYDYTNKSPGGRVKFSFPFVDHTFFAGIHIDQNKRMTPFLSISFNFFTPKNQPKYKPINYAQRVWCHGTYSLDKEGIGSSVKIEHEDVEESQLLPEYVSENKVLEDENQRINETEGEEGEEESSGWW